MSNLSLIALLSLLTASPLIASAQTPANPTTPECKGRYLDCAAKAMEANQLVVEPAYRKEIAAGAGFNMCQADLQKVQNDYNLWFRKHLPEFQALDNRIDLEIKTASQKISQELKKTQRVLPLEGQEDEAVDVTLADMIDHLKLYNERMKSCPKSQLADMKKIANMPGFSLLPVGHQQVVAAMETMTTNLNASLKQSGATYSLVFVKGDCTNELNYRVEIEQGNNKIQLDFPILDPSFERVSLTESEKWNLIRKNNVKIAGKPADGRARYAVFQQNRLASCRENWATIASSNQGSPFVLYQDLSIGAAPTANGIGGQLEWVEKPRATNVNHGYGIGVDASGTLWTSAGNVIHYLSEGTSTWTSANVANINLGELFSLASGQIFVTDRNGYDLYEAGTQVKKVLSNVSGCTDFISSSTGELFALRGYSVDRIDLNRQVLTNAYTFARSISSHFFQLSDGNFYSPENYGNQIHTVGETGSPSKAWKDSPERWKRIRSITNGTAYGLGEDGNFYVFEKNSKAWKPFMKGPDARSPVSAFAVNDAGYFCAILQDSRIFCLAQP